MKKVMLVEDEVMIREGLAEIIDWEADGMQVIHMAADGKEALALWEQEPVDIIVTDLEMPQMGGLELLKNIRSMDKRVRFVILTGYDDFEYARTAIQYGVENYILKPINEDELEKAVLACAEKLDESDRKTISYMDEKINLMTFLTGKLSGEETENYLRMAGFLTKNPFIYAAIMKFDMERLRDVKIAAVIDVLTETSGYELRVIYLSSDSLLLLTETGSGTPEEVRECFANMQNKLESQHGILSFVSISQPFSDYRELPEQYRELVKLQKYLLIDGYGSCVNQEHIHNRKSADVVIDESRVRKLLFKEDKEGACNYLEDLFINNVKEEVAVDTLYQLAIKMAVILQDIKTEYKLQRKKRMRDLLEVIDSIYRAEDIFEIKVLLIGEIVEIIDNLHTEEVHYTPVVRQILAEVQSNYKEDMNLKTLAYKYHMNTSYLGQIFQKEVGCSFSQYLSNTKNSIAKDLILNTNMRINDIAKEVGYLDTSYFYRKFKQCYGVSPASLREMKKY